MSSEQFKCFVCHGVFDIDVVCRVSGELVCLECFTKPKQPLIIGSQAGVPTSLMLQRREFRNKYPQYTETLAKQFKYPDGAIQTRRDHIELVFARGETREMLLLNGLKTTKAELAYFDFLCSQGSVIHTLTKEGGYNEHQ